MTALVYNWWTLFVRLAIPDSHREAITSRPLLLSSVSRLTQSGRQKTIRITSQHGNHAQQKMVWKGVSEFFNRFKVIAPQLNRVECWRLILYKAMEAFFSEKAEQNEKWLPT